MVTAWSLSYNSDSVAIGPINQNLAYQKPDRETELNSDHPELRRLDRRAMCCAADCAFPEDTRGNE
jgi:hypothetical protein